MLLFAGLDTPIGCLVDFRVVASFLQKAESSLGFHNKRLSRYVYLVLNWFSLFDYIPVRPKGVGMNPSMVPYKVKRSCRILTPRGSCYILSYYE